MVNVSGWTAWPIVEHPIETMKVFANALHVARCIHACMSVCLCAHSPSVKSAGVLSSHGRTSQEKRFATGAESTTESVDMTTADGLVVLHYRNRPADRLLCREGNRLTSELPLGTVDAGVARILCRGH